MATKRRLSDVLREEAGDLSSQDEGAADDTADTEAADSDSAKPTEKSTKPAARASSTAGAKGRSPQSRSSASARTKSASTRSAAASTGRSAKTPAKETAPAETVAEADAADHAVDVAALQQSLETAIAQESILQRKVEGLESDLAQQRDLVKSLKADVRAVSKLQQELDEAKTMIRKLTQLNANEPQRDPSPESPAEEKALAEPSSITPSAPPPPPVGSTAMQLRRVLQSPIFPDPPSTQFTDDDIGWFD